MEKLYFVHTQNSVGGHWTSEYQSLKDAKVEVATIKKVNALVEEPHQFHGWVTEWEGYSLDDGSRVTKTATPVLGF